MISLSQPVCNALLLTAAFSFLALAGCGDSCPPGYELKAKLCIRLQLGGAGSATTGGAEAQAAAGTSGVLAGGTNGGSGGSAGSQNNVVPAAGGVGAAGAGGIAGTQGAPTNNVVPAAGAVAAAGVGAGGIAGAQEAPTPTDPVDPCSVQNGGCDPMAICAKSSSGRTCTCASGYSGDGLHCAPAALPAPEVCDGVDNDGDTKIDEGFKKNGCMGCGELEHEPKSACSDGDGECKSDGTWECQGTDHVTCSASAKPATAERCDQKDNDCDGRVDEGLDSLWYADCDVDGYASASAPGVSACAAPALNPGCGGWTQRKPTTGSADCDDNNAAYHPGAVFGTVSSGNGDLDCDGRTQKQPIIVASSSGAPPAPATMPPCALTLTCNCFDGKAHYPGFAYLDDTTPKNLLGAAITYEVVGREAASACARDAGDVVAGPYLAPVSGSTTCQPTMGTSGPYAVYYFRVTCQ